MSTLKPLNAIRYELTPTPGALQHLVSAPGTLDTIYQTTLIRISRLVVTPNLLGMLECVIPRPEDLQVFLNFASQNSVRKLDSDANDEKDMAREVVNSAIRSGDGIILGRDRHEVAAISAKAGFKVVTLDEIAQMQPTPPCYIL